MTFMYEITVKNKYVGGGVQLPVGLSVRIAHDSLMSPLYSTDGKKRILEAFKMQCGLDLSRCINVISSNYLTARKL